MNAFWAQWDDDELDSMQGVEREPKSGHKHDNANYHNIFEVEKDEEGDEENEGDGCFCGSCCMTCLGLSWEDFY